MATATATAAALLVLVAFAAFRRCFRRLLPRCCFNEGSQRKAAPDEEHVPTDTKAQNDRPLFHRNRSRNRRVLGRRPPSSRETRARRRRRPSHPAGICRSFCASKHRLNRQRTEASSQAPRDPIASSQAPRAEERLAAVLQPPEQRHRLGLVELS